MMAGDSSADDATRPLIAKHIKSKEQAQNAAINQEGRGPTEVDDDDSSGGCSEDVHLSRPWKKFTKPAPFLQEGFPDTLRTPPFCFKKRQARIDWRTIHAINVDSLIQEIDICKLETVLDTITFGDIQGEDTRNFTEQNFIKLFRLGQLMIEYLLHVQAVLAEHKSQLLSAGASAQRKGEKLRLRCLWQRDALKQSQRDLKHAKKTLKTYAILLRSSGKQTALQQVHHCPCCDKVFESGYYLDLHVSRRHQSPERAAAAHAQEERHATVLARTERTDGKRSLEQVKAETDAALQAQFERLHHNGSQSFASAAITSLQRALRDSNHRLDVAEQQLERLQSEVPVSMGSRRGEQGQDESGGGQRLRTLEHRFDDVEEQLQRIHKENIKLKTELDAAYGELVTLRSGKHRSTCNGAAGSSRISPTRGRTSNPSRKDRGASFEAVEHSNNAKAVEDWISETDERFSELSRGLEEDQADAIDERSYHSTHGAKPSPSSIARQLAEDQSITSEKEQWLKEHQHAPIAEMPYALSKYPHGRRSVATMQEKLSESFNGRLNEELKKFGISGNAAGISDELFSAAMSALERQRMSRYREVALNDRRIMEYERSTIEWHIERAVKSRDLDIMESIFEEETDSESGSAPSQLSDENLLHESDSLPGTRISSAVRTSPSPLRTPASVEKSSPSYSQHLPSPRRCSPTLKQRGGGFTEQFSTREFSWQDDCESQTFRVTGQVIAQRVKSPTNEVQDLILISPVSSPQAALEEDHLGLGDWDSDDSKSSSKSPDIQRQVMRDLQSRLESPADEQASSKTMAKQKGKQQLALKAKQRATSSNLSDEIKMLDDLDAEINELIQ